MLCCSCLTYAETDSTISKAPEIKAVASLDNGNAQTNSQISAEELNRHYADILEKTNEQLSLWWNPLGAFIGALGVLFAVGAIVAGIIIYRQGADYKKSLKEFEATYRVILDKVIQEKIAQLETFKSTIDVSIKEQQKQLETATADHRSQIESAIQNLERVKDNVIQSLQRPAVLPGFLAPTGTFFPSPSGFPPMMEKFHRCSKCGFEFKVGRPLYSQSISGAPVTCPNCGNIDVI